MRLIFTIIFLAVCSVIFGVPVGVALVIIGVCFLAVAKYAEALGCLGRIIDIILLVIGVTLIIVGICTL